MGTFNPSDTFRVLLVDPNENPYSLSGIFAMGSFNPSDTARVVLVDPDGNPYKATGGSGGGATIQVNGVDTSDQTLLNFVDTASVTWANPSGGIVEATAITGGTGTVTQVNTTAPITGGPITTTGTIGITQASALVDGFLSSTDWNTFNNKQPAGSYLTAVTSNAPLSGSGTAGSHLVISQSGVATDGYLSSTDWNTFNNKQPAGSYLTSSTGVTSVAKNGSTALHGDVTLSEGANITLTQVGQDISIAATGGGGSGTVTNVATSNGITGGPITTTGTISGIDAAADGVTKGVAAFTASDFDAAAGVISIDYANGQAADATHKGFLTSTDWSTFNAKQPAGSYLTAVTADAPLSGSGTSGSHLVAAVFVGSGASHATGIVPDPGASAGTTKFLREDASWAVPAGGGGTVVFQNPGLRLTLTTGVPVTTSDVTAAGTLYWTPYTSGNVWYWDGSAWQVETITEQSLSLTLTSGKNYDVFYLHGTGLVLSSAWTDNTTRADALGTQNGVTVLSSDHTKLWIGTIRASGTNVLEDSVLNRFVINNFNEVDRQLFSCPGYVDDNAATSYTTNSSTFVAANGGTGATVNFLTLLGNTVKFSINVIADNTNTGGASAGLGIDLTLSAIFEILGRALTNSRLAASGGYEKPLPDGFHSATLLIRASSGTITFYADDARNGSAADPFLSYIRVSVKG